MKYRPNKTFFWSAAIGCLLLGTNVVSADTLGPGSGDPYPLTNANRACFDLPGSDGFVQNNCTTLKAWDITIPRKVSTCTGAISTGCNGSSQISVKAFVQTSSNPTQFDARLFGYSALGQLLTSTAPVHPNSSGTFSSVHTISLVNSGFAILEYSVPPTGHVGVTFY